MEAARIAGAPVYAPAPAYYPPPVYPPPVYAYPYYAPYAYPAYYLLGITFGWGWGGGYRHYRR